ncbi:MAG: hypothetical protein AB7M93_30795 [Candidatus Obscuribacterales bacterium]
MEEFARDYNTIAVEAGRLQERAERLQRELFETQIAQAGYRVRRFEQQLAYTWRSPILYRQLVQGTFPLLFEQDRAALTLIIRESPELAPQAQAVLDQMGNLIGYATSRPGQNPCPLRRVPPNLPQNPDTPCN